jgi:glycine dehydrogenase
MLLVVIAAMYAVYHGPDGLAAIARRVHRYAGVLADALRRGGVDVRQGAFFDTIQVKVRAAATTTPSRSRATRRRPASTSGRCCGRSG